VIIKTAVNTLKIIISLKFDTVKYFKANVSSIQVITGRKG